MKILNMLVGNIPDDEVNELAFWFWIAVIYVAVILGLTVLGRMVL